MIALFYLSNKMKISYNKIYNKKWLTSKMMLNQ